MHTPIHLWIELVSRGSLEYEPEDFPVRAQGAALLRASLFPAILADLLIQ